MRGIKRKSDLGSIFFCWLEQPEIRHYFNSQYTVFWKSWILEKGLKFPHQFSRPGKIYIKCFISEIFLHFGQILFNLAHTFAAHHGNKNNWTLKHHVTWRLPAHSNLKLPSVCEKNVFRFFRSSASRKPHSFLSWRCVLVRIFQWKILRAWYRVTVQARVFLLMMSFIVTLLVCFFS